MPMIVSVKGRPEVASAGIACSRVCRRPGGGFAATVELNLALVLPDGTEFRGGAKHVYVQVFPVPWRSVGIVKRGKKRPAAATTATTKSTTPTKRKAVKKPAAAGATRSRARP